MGLCCCSGGNRGHGADADAVHVEVGGDQQDGFDAEYVLGRKLGDSGQSVVYEAMRKGEPTALKVAVRILMKVGEFMDEAVAMREEARILEMVQHDNIVRVLGFFDEARRCCLVGELVEAGDVFDRLIEKGFYPEADARDLVRNVLRGIKCCHDANVVHRNLKLENLLLCSAESETRIRIAGFEIAARIQEDSSLSEQCGGQCYSAPEMLKNEQYGKPVDMWAIGHITFTLLCGFPPFVDENNNTTALIRKIKNAEYEFDEVYWGPVSAEAKDFVRRLLQADPLGRLTAEHALQHPWFAGKSHDTAKEEPNTDP